VVFAPSASNSYASSAFSGIGDSLFAAKAALAAEQDAAWWRVQVNSYTWLNRLLLAHCQPLKLEFLSIFGQEDMGDQFILTIQHLLSKYLNSTPPQT